VAIEPEASVTLSHRHCRCCCCHFCCSCRHRIPPLARPHACAHPAPPNPTTWSCLFGLRSCSPGHVCARCLSPLPGHARLASARSHSSSFGVVRARLASVCACLCLSCSFGFRSFSFVLIHPCLCLFGFCLHSFVLVQPLTCACIKYVVSTYMVNRLTFIS
jgi:hypothetical protein